MSQSMHTLEVSIRERIAAHGFVSAGMIPVGELPEADETALHTWLKSSYHGDMAYLQKNRERLCDSRTLSGSGKTLVMVAAPYYVHPATQRPAGHGRVARYAQGRDYHKVLPKMLKIIGEELLLIDKRLKVSRIFTDSIPLLERAFAREAGVGFVGKNTMMIRKGIGSFTLLGGLLIDYEIESSSSSSSKGFCGSCTRCLTQCPTRAFVSPYILDARRCIAYLTIEKRGMMNREERRFLGEWVFGCDVCQEVCPFNHIALKNGMMKWFSELSPLHGCGPFLDLRALLSLRSDEEFVERFKGTPLMRAKRVGLLRNAACVAEATADETLIPALWEALQRDSSEIVRYHCAAALVSFRTRNSGTQYFDTQRKGEGSAQAFWDRVYEHLRKDESPLVRNCIQEE
jgi:epoxyqueuosine reductase